MCHLTFNVKKSPADVCRPSVETRNSSEVVSPADDDAIGSGVDTVRSDDDDDDDDAVSVAEGGPFVVDNAVVVVVIVVDIADEGGSDVDDDASVVSLSRVDGTPLVELLKG